MTLMKIAAGMERKNKFKRHRNILRNVAVSCFSTWATHCKRPFQVLGRIQKFCAELRQMHCRLFSFGKRGLGFLLQRTMCAWPHNSPIKASISGPQFTERFMCGKLVLHEAHTWDLQMFHIQYHSSVWWKWRKCSIFNWESRWSHPAGGMVPKKPMDVGGGPVPAQNHSCKEMKWMLFVYEECGTDSQSYYYCC